MVILLDNPEVMTYSPSNPMARIKINRQFKRSSFRERSFFCAHCDKTTKQWTWDDVTAIRCPGCWGGAGRVDRMSQKLTSEVTAYYRGPDGKLFIPGAGDSRLVPPGYERIEIKNFRDRDRFYREANLSDQMEHEQNAETEEIVFGEMRRQERSDLFHQMSTMSNEGREFARRAIEQNNQKSERYESRGYLVGWEFDRGNR
jgi:hypothetical protein